MSERFETDRFLTDFSRAWSKQELDIDPPQYALNEVDAYFKQQKTNATIQEFPGGFYVQSSDASDVIELFGGREYIPIPRSLCAELGAYIASLAGPASGGAIGSPDVSQRSAPVPSQNELAARSLAPNIPGVQVKSQHERNLESMERALGIRHR